MNSVLRLTDINKSFGGKTIIKQLSLEIEKGEFITILGPSGCGKTTTLRLIAGLETADAGKIFLNQEDITNLEPNKRNINTIFQSYALFPHMNVYENISYGPRLKKMDKSEIKKKVSEMLALVKLEGYEKYPPQKLSGGMRQRVAIARALINHPEILLLDEPLGALDHNLRLHMQQELKSIQLTTKTTFIYVTHDQEEALNLSDRIIVMNKGEVEQIGSPEAIYQRPRTRFVAEFVGERNLFPAQVKAVTQVEGESVATLEVLGREIRHTIKQDELISPGEITSGKQVLIAVHADNILLSKEPSPQTWKAKVLGQFYTGSKTKTNLQVSGDKEGKLIKVTEYGKRSVFDTGAEVYFSWRDEDGFVIKE